MPVTLLSPVRRLSQAEFGELAYSVMRCVFQIHSEFGRLFDEKIYKRELAYRHTGVQLEFPLELTHAAFRKLQYIDVLVDAGGPFEFKTVECLSPRHSSQLLHYMLLAELGHGKLVNLRNGSVQHEFVNTTLRRADRVCFETLNEQWNDAIIGAEPFRQRLTELLRDWGTGLDLHLYEEALTHLLASEGSGLSDVEVRAPDHTLGRHRIHVAAPRVAFTLTALAHDAQAEFENHARRLLHHTELEAILWANIGLKLVTFTAIA